MAINPNACAGHYGEAFPVINEECTGHVQKRMGGGLHKLKRKRRGQKGMIDRIQNNYGEAIRSHSDIDSMKKAIDAILHHMIKDDTMPLVQQHMYCPRHSKMWCKFWLNKLHDKGVPMMKVPDYQLYSKQNYIHYLMDFQSSVTPKG